MEVINLLRSSCKWLVLVSILFLSYSGYSQNCDGADGLFPPLSGNTVVANGDICANTAVVPYRWEITYTNVNDGGNPALVEFFIDWDDGTTSTIQQGAGDNFIQQTGPNSYRAIVTHLFPATGGAVQCEYVPEVSLQVAGTVCPSTVQNPSPVVRWNTDDENTGVMELSEQVTSNIIFEVCAGETATVSFIDRSEFNCIPANFPGFPPNTRTRWFQFVYGGDPVNNSITGTGITVNPNTGSTPEPGPNIVLGTGASYFSNVVQKVQPIDAPTEFTWDITVAADAQPGEEFAITLNNWNACNPYLSGGLPTGNLPVQFTALIRIITSPPPPAYVPQDYCVNTAIDLTAVPTSGGVINWYSDVAATNLIHTGATMDALNDPPGAFQTDNTVAGTWTYYATETLGNNCEGPPQTVTFEIFAEPTASVAGPPQTVCTTTATLAANNPGLGVGQWSKISGPGTVDNPALFNSGVSGLSDATPTVFRWTITNGPCSSISDVTITRDPAPDVADAGPDQFECNALGATLAANTPTTGIGSWAQTGGPPGPTIADPTDPGTTVTGLVGGNMYTFRWRITNGVCAASDSFVNITTDLDPPAMAGPDLSVCPPDDFVTMAGSDPTPGSGVWTVISGPGTPTNATQSDTQITGIIAQTDLTWTVTNGVCVSVSPISITLDVPPSPAVPGLDDTSCDGTYIFSGTNPASGTGTWGIISGTGTFGDPNDATTTVTGLAEGINVFSWTVDNACGSNSQNITITNNQPTTSVAGPNQNLCDVTLTTLAANTPTAGAGQWTQVGGPVGPMIVTDTDPGTQVTGMTPGNSYTFRWTITNGGCPTSQSDVTINIDAAPDASVAGPGQVICGNSTTLNANVPVVGSGTWNVITGDGAESFGNSNLATSSFSGTAGFTYVLEWEISNGICPDETSQVTIQFDQNPTVANAGPPQVVCGNTTNLAANNPAVGTGLWSVVTGDGSEAFTNNGLFNTQFSGTPGFTYTLRWTISNGSCLDSQSDVNIQFDQSATVPDAGPPQVVCGGTTNLAGNVIAVGTGIWVITAGDGSGNVAAPNDPLSQFDGTPGQSYTLEWRSSNGSCATLIDAVTITFDALPSVSVPGADQTVCGSTTNLNATFPLVGTGLWSVISNPDGLGTLVTPSATNSVFNGTPGETYIVRWSVSNGVCPPNENDISITFEDSPDVADAGTPQVVCASVTTLDGNDPVIGTGAWSILSNPDGLGVVLNPNQFDSQFSGSNGITYLLQWTITNGICPSTQDQVSITMGPSIAAPVISGTTQGCVGDILTFTVPGGNPAVYNYTWDLTNLPPSTQVVPGSGSPFHFISLEFFDPSAGDLTVSIEDKATFCAGPSETVVLDINQVPDMQLVSDEVTLTVCETQVVTFTATDLNGVADTYEFILNGSIVQSGPLDFYSTILPAFNTMTVKGYAGICESPPSAPIIHVVNSNPQKFFVNGGGAVCQGDAGATISLNNSTAGVDYELFRDGISTTEVITSTGGSFDFSPQPIAGTYTVEAVNTNNCQITMEGAPIVVLNPLPTVFTIGGGGSYCIGDAGLEITLDGSEAGIEYELRRNTLPTGNILPGNGALLSFGFITEAGDYTIIATNTTTSCEVPMNGISTISITPLPVLDPSINTPIICSGEPLDIVINSDLGGSTFTWTAFASSGNVTGMNDQVGAVNEGTVINDIIINTDTDPQSVFYEIIPVNACPGAVETIEILVNPLPEISILQDQTVCEGAATQLTFESIGAVPFDIVYSDGSNNFNIQNVGNQHTIIVNPNTTTTYSVVSVTDGNGCVFSPIGEEAVITVETINVDFSTIQPTQSCSPYEVTFENNDIQAGIEYTWSWGDGTIDEVSNAPSITHTFINNSTTISLTYNVTLTARNNNVAPACIASQVIPITLLPTVNTNLTANIDVGCSPVNVSIMNNSIGASSHNWFYRVQGTTDVTNVRNTPDVNYTLTNTTTAPLIYEIVYEGTNGVCTVTEITEVTVYPQVNASFNVNGGTMPAPVTLANTPHAVISNTSPDVPGWTYEWDYGDGNTSTGHQPINPYTYSNFGNFNIVLTVTEPDGSCTDTEAVFLRVEPAIPIIDFSATPLSGCRPLEVSFTNNSFSVDPDTYLWEFYSGTGALIGTSTELNPTFIFNSPGIYSVRLSGDNSLGTSAEEYKQNYIDVYGLPTASFQVRPDIVFLPDGILFTQNTSFNATDYEWDFGDGTISNDFQPEHTYSQTGTYSIELIAYNAQGCSDTTRLENVVQVIDGGTLRIPNAFTPSLDGPSGGVSGAGTFNDVFLPIIDGVEKFNMQVFDRWGNVIFESNDKTIGWDGYDRNGKLLPTGVYVYKIQMQFSNKEKFEKIGDITLIR